MGKKYLVRLTAEERVLLTELVNKGQAAAYKIKHANVLLKVAAGGPNWSDEQTAEAFSGTSRTVSGLRQRVVEQGLEAALERQKREHPARAPLADGEQEARLIQIACREPPAGHARWTLRLLAAELVALEVVESICAPTVMRALKTTNSNCIGAPVG